MNIKRNRYIYTTIATVIIQKEIDIHVKVNGREREKDIKIMRQEKPWKG